MRPRKAYEFPDGYNSSFGPERFRIPEILFDPQKHMIKVLRYFDIPMILLFIHCRRRICPRKRNRLLVYLEWC
jgi:hypothetical protein